MPQSTAIDLVSPPSSSDLHLWADYIELLCLANIDKAISRADVLDRLQEEADLDETLNDTSDGPSLQPAAKSDRRAQQADDWFSQLQYRSSVFGQAYPFYLSDDERTLYRQPRMTKRRKLYIFFLLSSSLSRINKKRWNDLTSAFEFASAAALRKLLPNSGRTYVFGTNKLNRSGRYSGKVWDKIQKLAGDLGETVVCSEDDFDARNTGDQGLDVVGWVPFADDAEGRLIVFGQCTCTPDWAAKQHESSENAWSPIIHFTAPLNNMVFIPFCFRTSNGSWYNRVDIQRSILVDRLRLIFHLWDSNRSLDNKIPYAFVEAVLGYQEPVF